MVGYLFIFPCSKLVIVFLNVVSCQSWLSRTVGFGGITVEHMYDRGNRLIYTLWFIAFKNWESRDLLSLILTSECSENQKIFMVNLVLKLI